MIFIKNPASANDPNRDIWEVIAAVATLHMHIEARMVGDHVRLAKVVAPVGGDPFVWCPGAWLVAEARS